MKKKKINKIVRHANSNPSNVNFDVIAKNTFIFSGLVVQSQISSVSHASLTFFFIELSKKISNSTDSFPK